jgi:hypothetical protein
LEIEIIADAEWMKARKRIRDGYDMLLKEEAV